MPGRVKFKAKTARGTTFPAHSARGHDIIKEFNAFHPSIAICALEHHERLDGSGYPRGIAHLSFEAQLIGLIDSFEQLTAVERPHRKLKNAYETLRLIKDEVMVQGKFNKDIFKDLCNSLI